MGCKFEVETNYFFDHNIIEVIILDSQEELSAIVHKELPEGNREIGGLFVNTDLNIDKMDGAKIGTIYFVNGKYLCLEVLCHECSHAVTTLWTTFVQKYEDVLTEERCSTDSLGDIIPRFKDKDWDDLDELIAHATGRLITDVYQRVVENGYKIHLYI